MSQILLDTLLLLIAVTTILLLFHKRVRDSSLWRATITPLASIIGSGFLIVAPLLDSVVNGWAPLAIAGVVLLAYGIGAVMRFNIRYLEPRLGDGALPRELNFLTELSDLALVLAYVVSVAFYLRLLASFLLRTVDVEHELLANGITTVILAFIGITGLIRGLHALEDLEKYAVHVKLAIIASLLFGLAWFDLGVWQEGGMALNMGAIEDWPHTLRILAGVLIIIQGFETSRYMGDEYAAEVRIRTMRYAQWISGAIYIVFVMLAMPMFAGVRIEPDETAIIGLSARVAEVLPAMLIVAALMSQFSAAVADTIGAGGLLFEASRKRLNPRLGYGLVTVVAIVLVWSANIFEIIALASRAFAFYYLIQTIIALAVGYREGRGHWLQHLGHVLIAVILVLVVLFALPAA